MTLTTGGSFNDKVNFIWSVADLLRGDFKRSEYAKIILPLVVIRRLDCVLADSKANVVERATQLAGRVDNPDQALQAVAGREFYNTSPLDFATLTADPANVATHLREYIGGFSPGAFDVIEKFRFDAQITRLDEADLLYQVVARFADIDLHTDAVDNTEMGYVYEELIRRFSEQSNETAGEHFTPREVIHLMVDLLFAEDDRLLREPGVVKTLFDPACGTGGMLAVAEDRLRELNPQAHLAVFGQELNDESYAMCRSDMMLKGQTSANIRSGNSFSKDAFPGQRFDYMLANPPFGVEWKKVRVAVTDEAKTLGFHGRFGAGLPRINDGSLLFLQHMISKMKPAAEGGTRLAIVFNGSPLFTGAAGSGESEIRRWIIENDWLEAVVALPDQLFYNTGISTYFWIATNRKRSERQGKVQLVDARELWAKMPKSLGDKRKRIDDDQIAEIVRLYGDFIEGDRVKILPNESFGFQRITVERPLLDDDGTIVTDRAGRAKPDTARRDQENVPLPPGTPEWDQADEAAAKRLAEPAHRKVVDDYVKAEIQPWVPDAWVDHAKTKVGYEIPLTRHFYRYTPPRPSPRSMPNSKPWRRGCRNSWSRWWSDGGNGSAEVRRFDQRRQARRGHGSGHDDSLHRHWRSGPQQAHRAARRLGLRRVPVPCAATRAARRHDRQHRAHLSARDLGRRRAHRGPRCVDGLRCSSAQRRRCPVLGMGLAERHLRRGGRGPERRCELSGDQSRRSRHDPCAVATPRAAAADR
jgi:type I restriction enzyme M protein